MKERKTFGFFTGQRAEHLFPLLLALAALGITVWVRVRLLGTPLERDEGEFAYAGQLILKGLPPYLHAFSMKLPGMFYLNAAILKCFGATVTGVHLGLLVANVISALLLGLIGAVFFGTAAGAAAAAVFALMTVSQHFLGTFAHATHYVVLFALAAFSLIVSRQKNISAYRYLAAGIFFGIAFTMKQHAVLFLAAAAVFVLLESTSLRMAAGNVLTMSFGFSLPYLLTVMVTVLQGTFGNFWLWTARYAKSYATGLTPLLGWMNFRSQMEEIFSSMLPYWLLALVALLIVLFGKSRSARNFLLPLLCGSFLAICPGYHFRPHYFILVAPVVALLAGSLFASNILPKIARSLLLLALVAGVLFQLWNERWFLFAATPEEYVKKAYHTTKPFAETVAVARYVRENTGKTDRILVLGSEPQIYFYADRIAATGHIYMYPLVEDQPYAEMMREEMLKDMAVNRPRYVILVDDLSSWLAVAKSAPKFKSRLNDFVRNGYELDGVASVSREDKSFSVFGPGARQFIPNTNSRILVYKLKPEGVQ